MRGPHDWNIHGLVRFGNPRAKKVLHLRRRRGCPVGPGCRCGIRVALTGLARLARIDLPAHVEEIVIVRDDDGDGTPASEMLWRASSGCWETPTAGSR